MFNLKITILGVALAAAGGAGTAATIKPGEPAEWYNMLFGALIGYGAALIIIGVFFMLYNRRYR